MTIKELKTELDKFPDDMQVLVSSDEELNIMFEKIEVAHLTDINKAVIYGLSGTQIDI